MLLDEVPPSVAHLIALGSVDAAVAVSIKTGKCFLATGLRLDAALLAGGLCLGVFGVVQTAVVIVVEAPQDMSMPLRAHFGKTAVFVPGVLTPTLALFGAGGLSLGGVNPTVTVGVKAFDHFGMARAAGGGSGRRFGPGEGWDGE